MADGAARRNAPANHPTGVTFDPLIRAQARETGFRTPGETVRRSCAGSRSRETPGLPTAARRNARRSEWNSTRDRWTIRGDVVPRSDTIAIRVHEIDHGLMPLVPDGLRTDRPRRPDIK